MFITPHTSAAIWVSTKVHDPFLAFILSLVSHFALDMVPHGDDNLGEDKKGKEKFLYLLNVASIDMVVSCALVYFYLISHQGIDHVVLFWAVFGAWLPDLAWLTIESFRMTSLYWYIVYHAKLHNVFGWQYSIVYGVPFQILVTLTLVKMSF